MPRFRRFKRILFPVLAIGFALFSHLAPDDPLASETKLVPLVAIFGIDDFLIGLAIAGAASAASGVAGAVGSSNAAAAQEKSAKDAMGFQERAYTQQREDMAPWLNAGRSSLSDLLQQMQGGGFDNRMDTQTLANDPGYQFRMQQGQKALERSASARGMLNSGGALKSLARYSQGVASDEFQNAWNRNETENSGRFNRLASMAGVGQTAAQNLGAMSAQNSQQMGNLYGAIGNAQSAGAMGGANAFSGGMSSLGNLAMMGGMRGGLGNGTQYKIPTQYGGNGYPGYGSPGGYGPWGA